MKTEVECGEAPLVISNFLSGKSSGFLLQIYERNYLELEGYNLKWSLSDKDLGIWLGHSNQLAIVDCKFEQGALEKDD